MYSKILIPVDMAHTERAESMIEAGKKLAGENSTFILLNIVQDIPAMVDISIPHEVLEKAKSEAADSLKSIAQNSGITAEAIVHMGHPANDILNYIAENDVDLVIVGSHKPGLQDYFLGSTAAKVVRHAKCPVLVLR